MTPVDYEHRSCLRLRVTLHFGRQFADLRRVREPPVLVRHDADRQRHQRHSMQLAALVLAEIIARAAVLLVVLIRHERIEHIEYFAAHGPMLSIGSTKMKSSPPMCPTKPCFPIMPRTTSC